MEISQTPYEAQPRHNWAGRWADAVKGTILEDAIVNDVGTKLFHPDLAPTRTMIVAHWSDSVKAVSTRRPDGQWFRTRHADDDGTPIWEPTSARLIGWRGNL